MSRAGRPSERAKRGAPRKRNLIGPQEILERIQQAGGLADHLYADPWGWRDELDTWADKWPERVVDFPTNSIRRMAPAIDRFRTALEEGRLRHNGDPALRRHALNGRLRKVGRDEDGRGRYTLEKAGPGRLIDALVASVLADEAAAHLPEPQRSYEPMVFVA